MDELSKWKLSNKKHCVLAGHVGCGKRTLIKEILHDHELTWISSELKKKDIFDVLKDSLMLVSFSKIFENKQTTIVIEDIDRFTSDTKFYRDILKLVEKSDKRIIFTCSTIRQGFKNVIKVPKKDNQTLFEQLSKLYPDKKPEFIRRCIVSSKGDIRACKNMIDFGTEFSKDSFCISGDAVKNVINNEYTFADTFNVLFTDFQNISEILFYNSYHLFDDKLYEYMSLGDNIFKSASINYDENLLMPSISLSCVYPAMKFKQSKPRMRYTKLSNNYTSRDNVTHEELYAFKNIIYPYFIKNNTILGNLTLDRACTLFKKSFGRYMKRSEKVSMENAIKNSI